MTVLTSNYKKQDISLVKFWDYSIELLDKSNSNCYHIYLNISVVYQSILNQWVKDGGGGGLRINTSYFCLKYVYKPHQRSCIIKKNDKMNYNI